MSDCLQILIKRQVILFLRLVQGICMLLADFSIDLARELGTNCNVLSFFEHSFLEQVLNLKVILHFGKLEDAESALFILDLHVDAFGIKAYICLPWLSLFSLNFYLEYLWISCAV